MASDELTERASEAPAVRRMRALVEWVGEGQPLTQNSQLPARGRVSPCVELLETGDVLDVRYPLQSSAELHWLTPVGAKWAKACRLVRVVHGRRLLPVNKATSLLGRPLELDRPDARGAAATRPAAGRFAGRVRRRPHG